MLIAQITDVHLGFEPGNPDENNRRRLDAVIEALLAGPDVPDMLIVTGDLTEHGDAESYARLRALLERYPEPKFLALGNHDKRTAFAEVFPDAPMPDGFAQYAFLADGLRVVVTDTLEEGRHGGGYCETRAAWLRATLDADRETPTLIVMHHPPFKAGIDWMNTMPDEGWVARFADAIDGHGQIVGIVCGHLHRAVTTSWRGITTTICSSTAPQLALDLRPIDGDTPDDRVMIVADAPAYALHRWDDGTLVSHFATAGAHNVVARYGASLQPMVQGMLAEQAEG